MEEILKETLKVAKIHLNRLKVAKKEILSLGAIDSLNLTDWEILKIVDTFIFRFIKLQYFLGNKVFKVFLKAIGEYNDAMSFIDILDKLEKLGVIESAEDWFKIRELRNRLTHEYPDEEDEIKRDLKLALGFSQILEQTLENIESYLKSRNLI